MFIPLSSDSVLHKFAPIFVITWTIGFVILITLIIGPVRYLLSAPS